MTYDVAIVGGGLAGLSCAYHLACRDLRVIVLEQRATCGAEASGKNAAMARQLVLDPVFARHAVRGARWLMEPPADVASTALLHPCGSLIRFDRSLQSKILELLQMQQPHGLASSLIRAAEAAARSPFAAHWQDGCITWTPTDGVVDLPRLVNGLLCAITQRGSLCLTNTTVTALRWQHAVWQLAVGTPAAATTETIAARCVVNAAGAWVDRVAALAGVAPLGFTPYRRHLFVTVPDSTVDPTGPFVWDDPRRFYARPCDGGVMFSVCDETAVPPDDDSTDAAMADRVRAFCAEHFPRYAAIPFAQAWSGLRTFAADRALQLRWAPDAQNFYWIAGLGGHGVTCAASIGDEAAAVIADYLH